MHTSDSTLALMDRSMVIMATVVSHSESPFRMEELFSPGTGSVTETSKSLSKNYPQPKKLSRPRSQPY